MLLPFFCKANTYRPSLGKVLLGRPNSHPTTTAQFLSQKKKNTFYSELYALQIHPSRFSIFIVIYLKNNNKIFLSKNQSKFVISIYIIIIIFFLNIALPQNSHISIYFGHKTLIYQIS